MTLRFGFELETQSTSETGYDGIFDLDFSEMLDKLDPIVRIHKAGFKVKQDSSVDGFEFTTIGGHSLKAAKAKAAWLLSPKFRHSINSGCSFHIHVSGIPVELRHSLEFRLRCVEYIAANLDRVPKRVRSRWRSDAREWFEITMSPNTRGFVYASSHGTLEFRCWGNVASSKDAARCLDLTREAVLYAKARQGGRGVSLLGVTATIDSVYQLQRILFGCTEELVA